MDQTSTNTSSIQRCLTSKQDDGLEVLFRPYVDILLNEAKQTSEATYSSWKNDRMRAFNKGPKTT